jgi:hypothetical protein
MHECFIGQLPKELRDKIFNGVFYKDGVRPMIKPTDCHTHFYTLEFFDSRTSAVRGGRFIPYSKNRDIAILFVSKAFYGYAVPVYYASREFSFNCTCLMANCFSRASQLVLSNIKVVEFSWKGEKRQEAFAKLKELTGLEKLRISIHDSTQDVLSHREERVREFFPPNSTPRFNRIVDTEGFDDLVQLRRLKEVEITADKSVLRSVRRKQEVENIEKLFKHAIRQPVVVPPGESGWSTMGPKQQ